MYKQIKNLAQLKRALIRGAEFIISWPTADFQKVKGAQPQSRIVNIVQTNGIYSINLDTGTIPNGGRGSWMDYGKAAFWGFSGDACTLYHSAGKEPGAEIFTIRVLDGVDGTAELQNILSAQRAKEEEEIAKNEAARLEAQAEENRRAQEKLGEAVESLISGQSVENSKITLNGKETTVFLALADRFGVDIPLRTRGYILKNLVSIKTNGTGSGYYHYGGKSQTVCTCAVKIYVAAKRAQEAAKAAQAVQKLQECEDTERNNEMAQEAGKSEMEESEMKTGQNGTQSIKFFWNGIKVNCGKTLIRCLYSLDNRHDGRECVTIYARDYSGHLPGDMFPVENGTDSYQDYFETDRADLFPGHPLYPYARAAAVSAKIREVKRFLPHDLEKIGTWADKSGYYTNQAVSKQEQLAKLEVEQRELPKGQPTAADVEAVHAMNLGAETARLADEKEQEQKEREAVLAMRNAGRVYIEEVAAAHPIREGAPVVTIQWSEHPAFYSWGEGELKLSVAAAEIVLKHYDDLRAEHNTATQSGGYDKTSFLIEYTDANGEPSTYEGRYDLGDNDGGLIAHIRAFAESYRDDRLPYHSEEDAAQISALADLLEEHTAAGRVVSVSVAPWVEEAVKALQEAAQERMRETMETLEMLTDEQLTAAVLVSPRDNPDVARFFLQELSRRDAKKALAVLRAWKEGLGPGDIDQIA